MHTTLVAIYELVVYNIILAIVLEYAHTNLVCIN